MVSEPSTSPTSTTMKAKPPCPARGVARPTKGAYRVSRCALDDNAASLQAVIHLACGEFDRLADFQLVVRGCRRFHGALFDHPFRPCNRLPVGTNDAPGQGDCSGCGVFLLYADDPPFVKPGPLERRIKQAAESGVGVNTGAGGQQHRQQSELCKSRHCPDRPRCGSARVNSATWHSVRSPSPLSGALPRVRVQVWKET